MNLYSFFDAILLVGLSDGTILGLGGSGPLKVFQFFLVYIYICVLILAICFNKFALFPSQQYY